MGACIRYFYEGTTFRMVHPLKTKKWLMRVAEKEGQAIESLSYIFCSDAYLFRLNKTHLKHRTLTDILTFQYHERGKPLAGDIFISIPRVRENARKYKVDFSDELHRVMVHGLLHLLGYRDKSQGQKKAMRKKETACLSLR